MHASRYKNRIFLIQALDWILLLVVAAAGYYAVLHVEPRELAAVGALFGLFLVDRFGDLSRVWIARLNVDMEIEQKQAGVRKSFLR